MTFLRDATPTGNSIMKPQSTFSPAPLRFIAGLRGHSFRPASPDFAYADAACVDPESLICLAASNPEGRFYGFVADDTARRAAETLAAQRGVFNAIFLTGRISEILARLNNGAVLPSMLDYLCCDESESALPDAERAALFDLAQNRLKPGGLLVTSYKPYDSDGGALRFLVRELAPEMNADQKQTFLLEIRKLATGYLSRHSDIDAKLKDSIVKGTPDEFFSLFAQGAATSMTFDTKVAMTGRGMAYAGDAQLTSNYVELAVPADAQELVVRCRDHALYEPIKDLALDRTVRSDIWVKPPFTLSSNAAELFGGFAYGITMPRDAVPSSFAAQGKTLDLSSPLYTKLIDLMAVLPVGVGDFLSHPSGQGENADKVIAAIQILVACGIAVPMRGKRAATNTASVAQPRFVGSFNRYIDKTSVTNDDVWMASPVLGCGVKVTAREALVMQALNRAGLANSVSALMPELRRLAETGQASAILPMSTPTPEAVQEMVRDIVGQSLPQWYAYGMLEAA